MAKNIETITVFAVKTVWAIDGREEHIDMKRYDTRAQAEQEVEAQTGRKYTISSEVIEEQVEPKFFAHYGYSDVHPYEVIRIISDNTIEVRRMKTEFDFSECEFIAGGFSAHCPNPSAQKVTITSNEDAPIERIRRGKKGWQQGKYMKFGITEQPSAHYDVNF